MKYVVGLGNPGDEYSRTRHNIGFMVIERAAELLTNKPQECNTASAELTTDTSQRILLWQHQENMLCLEVSIDSAPTRVESSNICFIKPQTYMNLSGDIFEYLPEDISPADILIVVDEIYLPLGRMRFRPGGSAGGHNGLSAIETGLASKEYPRLRVGIGGADESEKPSEGVTSEYQQRDATLADFVLAEFNKDETMLLKQVIDVAANGVLAWFEAGLQTAQQRYNGINLKI